MKGTRTNYPFPKQGQNNQTWRSKIRVHLLAENLGTNDKIHSKSQKYLILFNATELHSYKFHPIGSVFIKEYSQISVDALIHIT